MRRLPFTTNLLPILLLAVGACDAQPESGSEGDLGGKADRVNERPGDILRTSLKLDLATHRGEAVIDAHPDGRGRLSLDVGGLHDLDVDAPHRLRNGRLEIEQLPADARVTVHYGFDLHNKSDGLLPSGSTLLWPYYCGNLFPCHTEPSDGMTFDVNLENIPAGQVAIIPGSIDRDAPSYMLAFAVGAYDHADLGTTTAGTRVGVYWLPGGKTKALSGARHLADVFDWLEQHIGPYSFGREVGSVSVQWGEGAFGGMEHHPFWHVAEDAMNDQETHAHEAAHGWFGDGVRIRCWEDFVLSEGTVSYLAARALGQVAGADTEAAVWRDYQERLDGVDMSVLAWPRGCNQIDIIKDGLFSDGPYMRGAFFYRDVAKQIGADTLDQVLAAFYRDRRGTAAGFFDMLVAIEDMTGFDAGPLAMHWLR